MGDLTMARPTLAKGRDGDVSSGAFVCGLVKCLTQLR